ncbi:unnamed protein product [Prunus armeniaca]
MPSSRTASPENELLGICGHCLSILVQFWGVLKSGFTCPLQEQQSYCDFIAVVL